MATYLAAIGIVLPDRLVAEWMVLVGVVAPELGSALAMLLVQSVSGPNAKHCLRSSSLANARHRHSQIDHGPRPH
jgi:hypothetical protein